MAEDSELRTRVEQALADFALYPIDISVDDGVIYLNGTVESGLEKQKVERAVERVKGVRKVVNNLAIGEVVPVRLNTEGQPMEDADFQELDEFEPEVEPDLEDNIGTTDVMETTSEGEPFFPPTDPVVLPTSREEHGIRVTGGFAPTADDNLTPEAPPEHMPPVYYSDDEIEEAVLEALRRNASTASLVLRVGVRNGIAYVRGKVQSMEDVDQVEQVIAEVPGVLEVREELEIE